MCDNEEYFYNHIDYKILPAMGATPEISSRQFLQVTNAQGKGYARSTKSELEFIYHVSRETGVLLDPVYSGKALFHLIRELNEAPEVRRPMQIVVPYFSRLILSLVFVLEEVRGERHFVRTHRGPVRLIR